jgi:2-keto-4-pentenoate hydratase
MKSMNKNISAHEIKQLAHRQLLDYRAHNPGMCFSETGFYIDVKAAYSLQDAVTELRIRSGERVIGYKVGCTSPRTTAQFEIDGPIRGTLFADEVLEDRTCVNPNEFCQLSIEGEMALRIGENCQIEAAFPVIELHNFVFRATKKTLSELIANNGINAGIVLPNDHWQRSKAYISKEASLALKINGKNVGIASLWPKEGGPKQSLNWLINHLEDYGLKLMPGNIVLAGTTMGLYPVKDEDEIIVYIDEQPTVRCSIKATRKAISSHRLIQD